MKALFETYGFSHLMLSAGRFRSVPESSGVRAQVAEVFLAVLMIGVCAAGIAFNLRFLAALSSERKVRPVVYQLRMKLGTGEALVSPAPRAVRSRHRVRYRLACDLSSRPGSLKPACVDAGNKGSRAADASPDLPNKT